MKEIKRISVGQFDDIFGGGIVPGSVTLIGGNPGDGKTTLMLQLARELAVGRAAPVMFVAYGAGAAELKKTAERVGAVESIHIGGRPRECAGYMVDDSMSAELVQFLRVLAGGDDVPAILSSSLTKDGDLPGSMTMQHMADVIMTIIRDPKTETCIIEVWKNRYGVVGLPRVMRAFKLTREGLKPELGVVKKGKKTTR